ncbi:hypothetical protein RHMOL_Rhmol13G0036700 [Rhododendron molle]|uniref:Uncharacterized protein n=1 Tax=Rhododendron molle TaxID=49168 RepID=A0ACC0L3J8_RHOML|nr:hypothetical protein RHMOL_Rhmol13G0036700 [Rhododendron molle]
METPATMAATAMTEAPVTTMAYATNSTSLFSSLFILVLEGGETEARRTHTRERDSNHITGFGKELLQLCHRSSSETSPEVSEISETSLTFAGITESPPSVTSRYIC